MLRVIIGHLPACVYPAPGCSLRRVDKPRVWTVTEITAQVRGTLEPRFRDLTVQGEISNWRPAASGHLYFSLKDEGALLSAVMFRREAVGLPFQPADGQLVVARGNLSVYEKRGVYQLVCETLSPAGQGAILAMLEERKRKLAAEGLFSPERKRALPLLPRRVVVVSSPTGAVIQDILRVTRRRNPGLDITLVPAQVQGEGAAPILARRIRLAGRLGLGEVLIVARGGGSLEDLLPFYDEAVVRAIAESPIPVISAVGHETDFTFSDLAADVRAPTPSAAAEIVSAAREELTHRVRQLALTLERAVQTRLDRAALLLRQLKPQELLRNMTSYVSQYTQRLTGAATAISSGIADTLRRLRHRLDLASTEVEHRSPMEILRRGYAVVRHGRTGAVLRDASEASAHETIEVRLYRGGLTAEVTETHGQDTKL